MQLRDLIEELSRYTRRFQWPVMVETPSGELVPLEAVTYEEGEPARVVLRITAAEPVA